jgi:hypothetical protein
VAGLQDRAAIPAYQAAATVGPGRRATLREIRPCSSSTTAHDATSEAARRAGARSAQHDRTAARQRPADRVRRPVRRAASSRADARRRRQLPAEEIPKLRAGPRARDRLVLGSRQALFEACAAAPPREPLLGAPDLVRGGCRVGDAQTGFRIYRGASSRRPASRSRVRGRERRGPGARARGFWPTRSRAVPRAPRVRRRPADQPLTGPVVDSLAASRSRSVASSLREVRGRMVYRARAPTESHRAAPRSKCGHRAPLSLLIPASPLARIAKARRRTARRHLAPCVHGPQRPTCSPLPMRTAARAGPRAPGVLRPHVFLVRRRAAGSVTTVRQLRPRNGRCARSISIPTCAPWAAESRGTASARASPVRAARRHQGGRPTLYVAVACCASSSRLHGRC